MRIFAATTGVAFLLMGCEAPAEQSEAALAEPQTGSIPEFQTIAGADIFAMIIPANATADDLAMAARDQCGQREFCQVHGWVNEADAAKALPMTDREVSALSFQYAHNRNTGFENRLWDCERWPRDADECLPSD